MIGWCHLSCHTAWARRAELVVQALEEQVVNQRIAFPLIYISADIMTNEEHTAYFNRSKRQNGRVNDSRSSSQRGEITNKEANLCSRRNINLCFSVENNPTV